MQPDEFYRMRKQDWEALSQLLEQGQRGINHLTPEQVDQVGRLYRQATSDLALAQRDFPDHQITLFLNGLVAQAHAVIYRSEPLAYQRLKRFFRRGFPVAFRQALPFFIAAALFFIIPAVASGISTALQPRSAQWLLPAQAQDLIPVIERQELWTKIAIEDRPYASSFIMRNNIQVAFLAFSSGVLGGVLTAYVLLVNGLILGGLSGLTAHYGLGFDLWTFVIGHGVVELSVIFIAGGTGLMLGWAIIHPGLQRRRDALAQAARRAVRLLVGCIPLLVFAGLIEGFVSPAENIPWQVKWAVGLGSGAALYTYLLLAGREPHSAVEGVSRAE